MIIEVVGVKNLGFNDPKKRLYGLAAVKLTTSELGQIQISQWRIIKQFSGHWSIQPPTATSKNGDGVIQFHPIVKLPVDLEQRVKSMILSAWLKETSYEGNKKTE